MMSGLIRRLLASGSSSAHTMKSSAVLMKLARPSARPSGTMATKTVRTASRLVGRYCDRVRGRSTIKSRKMAFPRLFGWFMVPFTRFPRSTASCGLSELIPTPARCATQTTSWIATTPAIIWASR